jgi:hypothetical protein
MTKNQWPRRLILTSLSSTLAACMGMPLTSLPRLVQLQRRVLELDPADWLLAIQVDARLAPPATAVPMLQIELRPATPGAFEPVVQALPMRYERPTTLPQGLPKPDASQQWLLYSLPPASQEALRHVQARVRQLRDARDASRGGSLKVGIAQHGMAPNDPALAATRWETWLRTTRSEGFWALWSGSVAELLAQARGHAPGP